MSESRSLERTVGGFGIYLALGMAVSMVACAVEPPAGPDVDAPTEYLAGGGRVASDDAYGGEGHSGSTFPGGMPDIAPGFLPLFYSWQNCAGAPFAKVITSEAGWADWWASATACLPVPGPLGSEATTILPGDSAAADRPTDPSLPPQPPTWERPAVSFDSSSVIAIGLESAAGWNRHIQVTDVSTVEEATTVRFEVLTPGGDCLAVLMVPWDLEGAETSPVVAVRAPGPVGSTVTFVRTDVVWHCIVEPDPTIPLTVYYTDVPCELGPAEAVIRNGDRWQEWLDEAAACDARRWGGGIEPWYGDASPGVGSVEPGVPVEPPIWISPSVDFTTHAVLVLRAPEQTRWGGGVWLSSIEARSGGTTIEYTVMRPGTDCPSIDRGSVLRPTVAIRVALPLADPVAFVRTEKEIGCAWDMDVVVFR